MARFPNATERNVLEPGCARCPSLVDSRERIAWGVGPSDADVMVIGEAPGAGDPDAERWRGGNLTGMAYTTRHSGRRIRSLMAAVGYDDRTYYTNAVKCFPAGSDGSGREPTAEELANCRGHLDAEIEAVDPDVLVPTGKHATATLLAFDGRDLDGFVEQVLGPISVEALGVPAVPLLHPSYQDVWIARLGYDETTYRRELATRLNEVVG